MEWTGSAPWRRVLARAGTVLGVVLASLPVLEAGAGAAPVVSVSPATITYNDTSANDSFAEVRGTASSSSAVSIAGGSVLPNPPNTAVVFYTSGKVGTYGTLWMQNSGAWLYEPDIRAINGATGTVTDTFTFNATDGSGTGSQDLVVTVNGVEDTPALTVSTKIVSDITDDLAVTTNCGTGPNVGDPYRIDVGSSPGSEVCHKAFDNQTSTKYLNFTKTNSSVLIDLKRAWAITTLGLTTANDAIARDPTGFDMYGSNTSLSADMVLIKSVTGLAAPDTRFTAYPDTAIDATTAYRYLKLTFTAVKNFGGANSVQMSEIRLSGTTGTSSYTEGDPAMSIEPTLLLADDNTASASAAITSGLTTGDVLSFTNDGATMGTIAGSWNAGSGTLSLTGTGTVVQWQNALRAVKYSSTSVDPTAISSSRTVTWSVTDTAPTTTTATSTFPVIAVNSVPEIGGAAPVAMGTSSTSVIGAALTVADADSANLNGGVLTVAGPVTGDVVSIDTATGASTGNIRASGSNIQRYDGASWVTIGTAAGGSASTYTVTFSSTSVTPAVAQAVARAVQLTTDSTARTRTLSVTISDGDGGTSTAASIPVTSSSGVAASIALDSTADSGLSASDNITKSADLVYNASFSEAITGLASGDFSNSGTATGCVFTPSGDTAPVTVTVSGCGEGTVILTLAAGAVQASANASRVNEVVSAPTVTIDRTAPSVTLSAVTTSPTRSTSVTFKLSAGETLNCATVASADFSFTSISAIGTVTAGSNSCSFTAQSSVAMGSSGSTGISASGSFSVSDVAGNAAVSASGTPSVTVDRTVPSITSATLDAASDSGQSSSDRITKASTLTFSVAFSESVVGIAASDFRNAGTADNCTFSVSAATGFSVTVTASSCGAGTVILTIKKESLSGANGDGPSTEYNAPTVTIDRTAPTRSVITPTDDATDVARGANMVITFDEVVYRQSGNVVVYGPAASAFATIAITAAQITGTGTDTITINPTSDLGAGGNYYVNIPGSALADTAGNLFAGIADSTTWNFRTTDDIAPVTSVSIVATQVSSTSVSLSYTASDEGGLASITAYYSKAVNLSSPVACGTTTSSSLTGTVTCTIPDDLGMFYLYSRGTDSAGNVETAPGTADDSVELIDTLPTSSVTAVASTTNRTVTVNYTTSDNGTVTSMQVYYSSSASLTSPVSCATVTNPAATGTASCQLGSTQTTYYLYSRATDNRSQTEAAPGSADATVVYSNNRPVTSITAPANTTSRTVTVTYSSSDDGTVSSLAVYYSTSTNLTSPVSCATVTNPSATGTASCRLPVTPDTYYLYSQGTDDDGLVEVAPTSADAVVVYTNARPTSKVSGSSTATARAVTLSYTTDDNGTVDKITVFYSISAKLTSPTSCGSKNNPGDKGSVVCTLPNTSRTYYVWSVAIDDQDREESDPADADVVIELDLTPATSTATTEAPTTTTTTSTTTTVATAVVSPGTGGTGEGDLAGSPVVAPPTATTLAASATTTLPAVRRPRMSAATTTTSTTTTTLPPTVGVPMVEAGEAAIVSDGETQKATVTREDNAVRFQWSELWAVIKALDKNGVPLGLDAHGNIRVTPQAKVEVTASGFQPNSTAEAWVFSKPVRIGTAQVGADGKTSGTYSLPKKLSAGSHRIVLTGMNSAGKPVKFALGITVIEPPKSASRTLLVVLILAAVAFALFIPPVRRRRRRDTDLRVT